MLSELRSPQKLLKKTADLMVPYQQRFSKHRFYQEAQEHYEGEQQAFTGKYGTDVVLI